MYTSRARVTRQFISTLSACNKSLVSVIVKGELVCSNPIRFSDPWYLLQPVRHFELGQPEGVLRYREDPRSLHLRPIGVFEVTSNPCTHVALGRVRSATALPLSGIDGMWDCRCGEAFVNLSSHSSRAEGLIPASNMCTVINWISEDNPDGVWFGESHRVEGLRPLS